MEKFSICVDCGSDKTYVDKNGYQKWCEREQGRHICKKCWNREYRKNNKEYYKQYYIDNKDKIHQTQKQYRETHKKEKAVYDKQYFETHKIPDMLYQKQYRNNLKNKLLLILGGKKCSNPNCLVSGGCTDIRCLQFDHINGDGARERKKFNGNWEMLRFYIKNPELARQNLQVFCANCNWIKKYDNGEHAFSGKS